MIGRRTVATATVSPHMTSPNVMRSVSLSNVYLIVSVVLDQSLLVIKNLFVTVNNVSPVFCLVFPWAREWCASLSNEADMESVTVSQFLTRKDLVNVGICCKKALWDMTEFDGLDEEGIDTDNCHLSDFFDSE